MVQTRSVKKRRAGRNRMGGERENCGHLKSTPSRAPQKERGWANMHPVLEARCRKRGLRPSDDNLRAMRDPLEGYSLGKLKNDGAITEEQHGAGQKYWVAYYNWAKSAGMPRITAKASSYGLVSPGRSDVPDEVAEAAQRIYYAAADVLKRAGMPAEWECKRVCLEDERVINLIALSSGLNRLWDHFK